MIKAIWYQVSGFPLGHHLKDGWYRWDGQSMTPGGLTEAAGPYRTFSEAKGQDFETSESLTEELNHFLDSQELPRMSLETLIGHLQAVEPDESRWQLSPRIKSQLEYLISMIDRWQKETERKKDERP